MGAAAAQEEEDVHFKPFLSSYPEMILAAITALGEKNGSNKTSISKYIESLHRELPPTHTTLLSHHLNKMKNNGDLVFWKNNYMKPDPNAPPRRGRGRPPKDPNAPPKPSKPKSPSAASMGSGRPRGRPRKTPKTMEEEMNESSANTTVVTMATGNGRARGRPPKVKPATFTEVN
ncbi:HMG-Y-related protein A [Euphorbia peplus]|nr:HMG-Y-related protein A [Euphorbia peplus]